MTMNSGCSSTEPTLLSDLFELIDAALQQGRAIERVDHPAATVAHRRALAALGRILQRGGRGPDRTRRTARLAGSQQPRPPRRRRWDQHVTLTHPADSLRRSGRALQLRAMRRPAEPPSPNEAKRMTVLDRSTERRSLIADGTVPDMDRRPGIARRLWADFTPNDGTLTTRVLVRFRGVVFVVLLCALSALGGAQLAERRAPSLCLDQQCWMELTPRHGGLVTVRRSYPGEPVREAKVPEACLQSGPANAGPDCPAWIWETSPSLDVVGG